MADEKQKQVADQCRAVAHMATAIANIYTDYARLFADGHMDRLEDQVGERTAALMNTLGDILIGGDAVTDDDEWVNPIMERAKIMFPEKQCAKCNKPVPHDYHSTRMGKRYHIECDQEVLQN